MMLAYRWLPESNIDIGAKGQGAMTAPIGYRRLSIRTNRQVLDSNGLGTHVIYRHRQRRPPKKQSEA